MAYTNQPRSSYPHYITTILPLVPFHNSINDPSATPGGLILAEILSLANPSLNFPLFPISANIELKKTYLPR